MVTRARLQRLSDQKTKALVKKTFRQFCICIAVFMCAIILVVILSPRGTPRPGELIRMLLAPSRPFLPVGPVPNAPSTSSQ